MLLALLLLAAAPSVLAAGRGELDMEVCSDASCSTGCTRWSTRSGACAPGNAGNSWVSSITTFSDSGDAWPSTAAWQLFQDSQASHSCAAANFIASCNATFTVDGSCRVATLCGGMVTVSYRVSGPTPAWVIAVIVVFGVLLPLACIASCCYLCWRPGGCCNNAERKVVGSTPAGLSVQTGAPGATPFYANDPAQAYVQQIHAQAQGGVYYAQAPQAPQPYYSQPLQQGPMMPMGYSTSAPSNFPAGFAQPVGGGGYPQQQRAV